MRQAENPPRLLSDRLDYYKPTMVALQQEEHPDAEVTFTFNNRTDVPLADNLDLGLLLARLEVVKCGFTQQEIDYLGGLTSSESEPVFTTENLDFFSELQLPTIRVGREHDGDLSIETRGAWPSVSLWETVVLSEVNEAYFAAQFEDDHQLQSALDEGDKRLTDKIEVLKKRPDIKIVDFGTRRRFSRAWHEHVVERLATEVPDNLVGTSNVWFANQFDLQPTGTYAHEMPMVYAGLSDQTPDGLGQSHRNFMKDWYNRYGVDLSIALTDTFGTDYFFEDFTPEQAQDWRGLRHDSGDPFLFGKTAIDFYRRNGIDPREKTIIFSDGLDLDKIIALQDTFANEINLGFGWGTNLTNDLGADALSIVMKATLANQTPTVKLSDNLAKAMGPTELVKHYRKTFDQAQRDVEYEETIY